MLTNCETPRSVEVALQSVAGATHDLDLSRIEKCKAWSMMGEQFLNSQLQDARPNQAVSRWGSSSLLQWGHFRHMRINGRYEYPTSRNTTLEAMIWAMQTQIDQLCAASSDLATKSDEVVKIRRLVSNTAHLCIKELYRTHEDSSSGTTPTHSWEYIMQQVEMVVALLERHLSSPDANVLHPMTYQALCISFTLLLCCFLAHCSPRIAVRYLLRLLRRPHGLASVEINLAMVAFVFSRHDLPGWSQPTQGHVDLRVQRALEVYHYYQKAKFEEISILECVEIGWLFLLASPQLHGLDHADVKLIAKEIQSPSIDFRRMLFIRNTLSARISKHSSIYTVPSYTELIENALRYLTQDVARDLDAALNNPHLAEAYSLVLCSSLDGLNRGRFEWVTPELYGFVLEVIKSRPDDSLKILSQIPLPQLSPLLDEYLDSRDIVSQLVGLLDDEEPGVQLFATSQIWHLIRVSSPTTYEQSKTRVALEQQLIKPDGTWSSADGLKEVSGLMKTQLYQLLEHPDLQSRRALWYGYRVMECMLEEDECSSSDPRMQKAQEWLDRREIHKSIRGLSSFIIFPPTQSQAHVV
ncbi:hypothetical protein RSOLAG1IB_12587 [Rhizoctonia solani AG-1 IB]|uniref:Uncharacterized protein n=2 Tax=Thanatephorus cucumeris (strain AG1-IB / isolate 7/3/14) TaxID=1108050 RepID=A0A0B7G2Z1_THACB|nr:hypothetical protein RSOLAG1IB_12587 [Rhizoctonia solani AG-1 IB]